jgi:hypothetical protein
MDADRQTVREVPDLALLSLADGNVRQVRLRDPGERQEVRRLLFGCPEPHQVGVLDDSVKHHQPLNRVVQSDGLTEPAVGLTDGCVQSSLVDVVDARAVVAAVEHRYVLQPHELGEELPGFLAVDDAAEPRVLARDADAAVEHYRRQKPRLTLGETLLGYSLDAFIEGHQNSSSMMLGVRPPLRPRLAWAVK